VGATEHHAETHRGLGTEQKGLGDGDGRRIGFFANSRSRYPVSTFPT